MINLYASDATTAKLFDTHRRLQQVWENVRELAKLVKIKKKKWLSYLAINKAFLSLLK